MFTLWLELAGALSLAIWVYLLLVHGRFWRISAFPPSGFTANQSQRGTIAVIIPARDEAAVIARSVSSLLAQNGNGRLHIFLVNDGSSDDTAALALATARQVNQSHALTVLTGQTLPSGWSGKLWAVQQGIQRAQESAPRYFLLTDADILHAPGELAALVEHLEAGNYDLVSLMVRLRCRSAAEALLIPAFLFFFFQLYPPVWIANPRRKAAGAAGGCILIRPQALERIGGIAAIRGEVIDDCALAQAVKATGGRIWLAPARASASLRDPEGFVGIGRMISRTAFRQLRHSSLMLLLTVLSMLLVYVLPGTLLLCGGAALRYLGVASSLLMIAAYWSTVNYYELNFLWTLSLPLAALFYLAATAHSALMYWSGRGGQWKGRVQDSN